MLFEELFIAWIQWHYNNGYRSTDGGSANNISYVFCLPLCESFYDNRDWSLLWIVCHKRDILFEWKESNIEESSRNECWLCVSTYREVSRLNGYVDECLTSLMCWSLCHKRHTHGAFHLNAEKNHQLISINHVKYGWRSGITKVLFKCTLFIFDELHNFQVINNIAKLKMNLPVCVLMCLFSKLGRSKAFPQTSHGRRFLSPRGARCFAGTTIVVSIKSPELLFPDDVYESPEIDFRSSSVLAGDEIGGITSARSDIDKSNGESGWKLRSWFIRILLQKSHHEEKVANMMCSDAEPLNQLTWAARNLCSHNIDSKWKTNPRWKISIKREKKLCDWFIGTTRLNA